MTPADVAYTTKNVWGQRHPPAEFREEESSFLYITTVQISYFSTQAPLQAQAEESCQEGGEGYEGYETWLFIAWTFGDEAVFRKISRSLVLTSTVSTFYGEDRLVNAYGILVGNVMPVSSVGQ